MGGVGFHPSISRDAAMGTFRPGYFWRFTLREVLRRPGRAVLTLVGIVLGVAAVVGSSLAESATRENYAGIYRPVAGRAALEVVPAGGEGSFLPNLPVVQGVRALVPVIFAPTTLATPAGPQPLFLLGIDPSIDSAARDLPPVDGLMIEAEYAARNGLAVGKTAKLITSRGPVEVTLSGLLPKRGPARFNGGAFGVLPIREAQALFGRPGEVSAVQLVLEPGTDPARVAATVLERLHGVEVRSPLDRGRLGGEFLLATEQMMRSLSAVALVAGSMVILNTFLMSLNERRRQLAMLRALGATRRQVIGLVARQALLIGLAGTLLGLPVGVALASLLVYLQETFLGVPMPRLPLAAGPMLLGATLGPALTLLAALMTAGRAAKLPPLAVITSRGGAPDDAPAPWHIALGFAGILLVGLYVAAVIAGRLPPALGQALMPLMAGLGLLGCACVLTLLLPALLWLAGRTVPALFGVEGRLAVRQLKRQRGRTGLTVGVLFAAVTACVAFGMSFRVNLLDIDRWYAGALDCDFLVRAVTPDPGLAVTAAPLPSSVADEIRQLPSCEQVSRFRFRPTRIHGVDALAFVREFPERVALPLVLDKGEVGPTREALARGEAAVSSALANRLGVGIGDYLTVPGRGGERRLRIAALVKEYTTGGMVFYVGWDAASGWLGDDVSGLTVTARPGEVEEFGADLADFCAKQGLLLQRNSDFALTIDRVVVAVRWFVVCMVGLVFLVAVIGVVNTLTTNVMDQTRELGVLRALGMRRGQVRKLVVAQAATLALASCLPGAPMGILMAYLMNRTTPGLVGHVIPFHVDFGFVAACLVGVAALAVLASLPPARRAANLAVLDALRYE